jgi:hypothetical protein
MTIQNKQQLLAKWEGMTKHIRSERKKLLTSKMLESQNQYFAEAAGTSSTPANSSTGSNSQGISQFKPIAMPLVARVFPELVTNDLVGVQPMSTPVGLAYALRYRYQTTAQGATAGDEAGYNTVYQLYSGSNPASGSASTPTSAGFGASANIVGGNNSVQNAVGYTTEIGELLNTEQRLATGNYPSGLDTNNLNSGAFNMREMGLSVEQQEIRAKTRKLKARWSLEAQQDLSNMHGVDIEEELTDLLAYEVSAEIDAEVKNNIIAIGQVGGVLVWDYRAGNVGAADGRWEQEKFRTLYTVCLKASNEIAQSTRRGAGNFILASPGVVAALEALEQFSVSSVATNLSTETSGVAKVGTIGRFTVYRDMFATNDYAVVGYKGPKDNDAGIIYCPYIPLMFSRAVGQEEFQPRIGVLTRYALCNNLFGSELYYRYVDVRGLPSSSLAGSLY